MPVRCLESLRVSPGAHKPGLKLLPYMIAIENEECILFIFVSWDHNHILREELKVNEYNIVNQLYSNIFFKNEWIWKGLEYTTSTYA